MKTTPIVVLLLIGIAAIILVVVFYSVREKKYKELENEVLQQLGFSSWNVVNYYDDSVIVKSRQTLNSYDPTEYFKDERGRLDMAKMALQRKNKIAQKLEEFLASNVFKERAYYDKIVGKIEDLIEYAKAYRFCVRYIFSAGNNLGEITLFLTEPDIGLYDNNPSLLMGKGEYNRYVKTQEKEALQKAQKRRYDKINSIIDYASNNKHNLFLKDSEKHVENLVTQLYEKTVNGIGKMKSVGDEGWRVVDNYISTFERDIKNVVEKNNKFLKYYQSSEFAKIKDTCESLMSTQREFNEYISEKVSVISRLFGTRVARNETVNEDEYQYVRPYKKTLSPFTAEVSAAVFASAENSPLEYVVKNFYPNKNLYPEQIQKLHLLVEELATLKEAKEIIENYKQEYQQYLRDVPDYIMKEDEAGFYARLGFANIDEDVLEVKYEFSYTSNGGMAKRSFSVPMTETTIVELIKALEGKLTMHAFTKEQRALMTAKLRETIKQRDNFTCRCCGNSTYAEPNLLLEIDHIVPVSKGGCTVEDNLQTLCWKCNRAKSDKLVL